MINISGRKKCFKCDKEGHPAYHCPEGNKKDCKKKKSDGNKSRASRYRKSSKSDIGKLKREMKKTFTTLEANINELGGDDSNPTSSDSEESSGNIHVQYHNRLTSLTGRDKFKIDPEDYIKTPGVTNPTGIVLHQAF